jgi:hypothetical protein
MGWMDDKRQAKDAHSGFGCIGRNCRFWRQWSILMMHVSKVGNQRHSIWDGQIVVHCRFLFAIDCRNPGWCCRSRGTDIISTRSEILTSLTGSGLDGIPIRSLPLSASLRGTFHPSEFLLAILTAGGYILPLLGPGFSGPSLYVQVWQALLQMEQRGNSRSLCAKVRPQVGFTLAESLDDWNGLTT